ncbi:MAG: MCE family protein [Blastochloris sp.]|nr:MCE family protein [Blastochloris sp.]
MKDNYLEIKVGTFFLLGLIAAGILVVAFGRFGKLTQSTYPITVQFANSSGVIKNSQVLYRGAKVGTVVEPPLIGEGGAYVELFLSIRSDIKIDRDSQFKIGVYGLLGDRFVDIIPPEKESGRFVEAGSVLKGTESKGFGDIAERLDKISAEIQQKLLTEEFATDIHDTVKNAKNLLGRMDTFMSEAESGKGTLYMLMKDEKVANDLRATISEIRQLSVNLRSRGILFYKDLSVEEKPVDRKYEADPRFQSR